MFEDEKKERKREVIKREMIKVKGSNNRKKKKII